MYKGTLKEAICQIREFEDDKDEDRFPLNESAKLQVATQILMAVSELQNPILPITHRFLKPTKIMLDGDHNVYLHEIKGRVIIDWKGTTSVSKANPD